MVSAEREPITGVWGLCPQRGPGAEPLVRFRGAKLKTFRVLEFDRSYILTTNLLSLPLL